MVRDGALPMFTSPSDSSFHRASSPSGIRLQEVRDRFESVVDYIDDGIITIDDHGLIDSVNPAAEKLFGYSAAEMLGQHLDLVITDPDETSIEPGSNGFKTSVAQIAGTGREAV